MCKLETIRNLKGSKEFNRLVIKNINEFFNGCGNRYDHYKAPYHILAELEKEIMFENNPDEVILISYKDDGFMVFDLVSIFEKNNFRVVVYEFNGTAS